MKAPRLRTVEKVRPPYKLGNFTAEFPAKVGRAIIYRLATRDAPSLEGPEWEQIFADAINAKWDPSNVGLDDIRLGNCAWGAKSVKNRRPFTVTNVRLISGRNNPEYSFGEIAQTEQGIGDQVLAIWNGRVGALRDKFAHLRTVVLIKSNTFTEFTVFETDTVMYPPDQYVWRRNNQGNLEGFGNATETHCFTWQRHGSQFTILETVPKTKLCFRVKVPPKLAETDVLSQIGFDPSWVEIVRSV